MANLTPLSISLPLDQKTKRIQRNRDSYEAKVKERGFKSGDNTKYDFGSEYRGKQATSPSAVDEASDGKKPPKYPASPLPFLAKNPLENVTIDSFTCPTTAESTFLAGQSKASNLKFGLQPQGNARQLFNSDVPSSLAAKTSSSLPASTEITTEKMGIIRDKDSYRSTAGASYSSDQEEGDADDEFVNESDLETHADDDDFNYAVDPEEEDRGYDSLKSQFKNVRIRKRQRDDVKDAEDEHEAWPGADAAHLDGVGKQKTLTMPLTEEERAHRGKKSRTAETDSGQDSSQDAPGAGKTLGFGAVKESVS